MKLRWAFNLITVFSLLVCMATMALWIRSYGDKSQPAGPDSFDLTHTEPLYWFVSNPGKLTFCRQVGKDWGQPVQHFNLLGLEYASSWVGNSSLFNLLVPYWMLICMSLLLPLNWIRGWQVQRQIRRRARSGLCRSCGYDLRATPDRCPECGRAVSLSIAEE